MEKTAQSIPPFQKPKLKKLVDAVRGKTLGELTDPLEKAVWIRTFDEAHNDRNYKKILPEGERDGYVTRKDGKRSKAAWQTNENIAAAVMALEANGDRKIISEAMGEAHKVRSFYNNFVDPFSDNDDVTIDTHATAAAWLQPYSQSASAVMHSLHLNPDKKAEDRGRVKSMSPGCHSVYGLYADAYREPHMSLVLRRLAIDHLKRLPDSTGTKEHARRIRRSGVFQKQDQPRRARGQ